MTDNGRVGIDFGKDGIWALFRAMFFPTLVGMIFNSALTIIDGVFVGQGVGADGIAAVNIVAPLFLVTTGIGLLFGIGAPAVSAMFLPPSDAAYGIAVKGLPLFSLCAAAFALNIAFIGYYQSIENAWTAITYTFLRGIVFLVPSFLLLPRARRVPGLWLAIPLAETLTLVIVLSVYLLTRKKR